IKYEYIPNELPPSFNSDLLSEHIETIIEKFNYEKVKPSKPLIFNGFKTVSSRRRFAIPNPYQYINAIKILVENQTELFEIFNKTSNSLTAPSNQSTSYGKAYDRKVTNFSEVKKEVKKLYKDNLFGLKLDIQFFFDSIYTHSISWAIHSKKLSKSNIKNFELLGNKIDASIQLLNDLQTNGILVGNAVSRIVSEILLCSVDYEIRKRDIKIDYLRYVDDYFIFTKDRAQIESIISIFREELDKYELVLNENKIEIIESPFVYGKSWVEEIKIYSSINIEKLLEKSIIEYHKYKDISIIKYVLKIIRTNTFTKDEWNSIEPILFNLLIKFPILTKNLVIILKNNFSFVRKTQLKRILYSVIDNHLHLRSDEEIIWIIWMFKSLGLSMSIDYIKKILRSENWIAIIILLDVLSERKNEIGIKRELSKFREKFKEEYFVGNAEENMNSEVWLLAYEIDFHKWLNTGGNKNEQFVEARKSPFFKELKRKNISFYDSNYQYELLAQGILQNNTYVTRKELINILNELEKDQELTDEEIEEIIISSIDIDENDY
ncbi:RNA-directed DNA polymerase, partial [Enterococcus faecalis]|nr:RNA-directed DNA polymerase [Enterococcus faecalis]